jgi:hypothetical protein
MLLPTPLPMPENIRANSLLIPGSLAGPFERACAPWTACGSGERRPPRLLSAKRPSRVLCCWLGLSDVRSRRSPGPEEFVCLIGTEVRELRCCSCGPLVPNDVLLTSCGVSAMFDLGSLYLFSEEYCCNGAGGFCLCSGNGP